jgi:hypothetical protein
VPTEFFFMALMRASLAGIVLCAVAFFFARLHPKLAHVFLRPAQVVASIVGVLLTVLLVGMIFGYPEPVNELFKTYRLD